MKTWVKRALRTFLQSAIGYILVAIPSINFFDDVSAIKTTLIGIGVSAVSAGLAALMNLLDEKLAEEEIKEEEESEDDI